MTTPTQTDSTIAKLRESNPVIDELCGRVAELERILATTDEQATRFVAERNAAQDRIAELERDLKEANAQARNTQRLWDGARNERDALQAKLDAVTKPVGDADALRTKLRELLNEAYSRSDMAWREIAFKLGDAPDNREAMTDGLTLEEAKAALERGSCVRVSWSFKGEQLSDTYRMLRGELQCFWKRGLEWKLSNSGTTIGAATAGRYGAQMSIVPDPSTTSTDHDQAVCDCGDCENVRAAEASHGGDDGQA